MCSAHIYFIGVFMSKFTFAFTKEKKQIFVPNGDKTRYIEISGCPIESVNGTYYQMDPITLNDYTYYSCLTNGIYLLETKNYFVGYNMNLYELNNSSKLKILSKNCSVSPSKNSFKGFKNEMKLILFCSNPFPTAEGSQHADTT